MAPILTTRIPIPISLLRAIPYSLLRPWSALEASRSLPTLFFNLLSLLSSPLAAAFFRFCRLFFFRLCLPSSSVFALPSAFPHTPAYTFLPLTAKVCTVYTHLPSISNCLPRIRATIFAISSLEIIRIITTYPRPASQPSSICYLSLPSIALAALAQISLVSQLS